CEMAGVANPPDTAKAPAPALVFKNVLRSITVSLFPSGPPTAAPVCHFFWRLAYRLRRSSSDLIRPALPERSSSKGYAMLRQARISGGSMPRRQTEVVDDGSRLPRDADALLQHDPGAGDDGDDRRPAGGHRAFLALQGDRDRAFGTRARPIR